MTTALVKEAVAAGARLESACNELGIDARTIQRWEAAPDGDDERRGPRAKPANALTPAEEEDVLALLNSAEFVDLTPHQVVAKLADMKIYKASERTMYRLLKRRKMLAHRGKSRPRTVRRPTEHRATGPREVWSWDITYLRSPIQGVFWLLYMVVDVWSRKVVAAKVHERESDELASALIDEACQREGVERAGLVVHADNGNAMKGKTLLATMQVLGIVPSFSRPHVSDDNPFSEALFPRSSTARTTRTAPSRTSERPRLGSTVSSAGITRTISTAGSASSPRPSATTATTSPSWRTASRSTAPPATGIPRAGRATLGTGTASKSSS